jgi:hypothetical protein
MDTNTWAWLLPAWLLVFPLLIAVVERARA